MHYYQFNIADYRKDTAHLTPIEHYIYRSLIDTYYLDENPIPNKTQSVLRRLSLGSDNEQNLQNVLDDFFSLKEDVWHHGKIDDDIKDYKENVVNRNRANGKKGGRPKKKTQSVSTGNPVVTQNNPNQELITNNYKPTIKKGKRFKKPSLSEIDNYILEKGLHNIKSDVFYDFYEGNGWKVGKNSMKDWQATIRNWSRRENEKSKPNNKFESRVERTARIIEEGADLSELGF